MFVMPACFNSGDTIYFPFDSYDSNGASVTITGLAVTDIEVYKNGSTTQRTSDNGYTLLDTDGIDFDATTGLHGFSIDTSDNSDAGFWADGAQYWVNINAITVDSQTVRFTYFLTLGYLLRPTTAGRKLDVSSGGEAGVDWANVGSPTTTVNLSGTTVKTATDVETDTADIQTRLPAALTAGGNIKADMLAISGDATAADNLEAMLDGTGGVSLTISTLTATTNAIAWNAAWDAEVQSEVDDALVAQNLDHLVKIAVDTNFATTVHADSVIGQIADNGAGFDRTTDSLEAIRDRGDAAWTTATGFSTHSAADVWTAGTRTLTAGTNIQLPSNGLANVTAWTVDITGNITGNLSGSVGSVTGNVGGNVAGTVASVVTKTGYSLTSDYDFAKGTTAMTEAYAANGVAPTPVQAIFAIHQYLQQFTISTTNYTVKKLDNSTTAFVVTLNDATTPTGASRT